MSVAVEENLQQKLSEIIGDLSVEKILEVIDLPNFCAKKTPKRKFKRKNRKSELPD